LPVTAIPVAATVLPTFLRVVGEQIQTLIESLVRSTIGA
jgi:hypothetical protein